MRPRCSCSCRPCLCLSCPDPCSRTSSAPHLWPMALAPSIAIHACPLAWHAQQAASWPTHGLPALHATQHARTGDGGKIAKALSDKTPACRTAMTEGRLHPQHTGKRTLTTRPAACAACAYRQKWWWALQPHSDCPPPVTGSVAQRQSMLHTAFSALCPLQERLTVSFSAAPHAGIFEGGCYAPPTCPSHPSKPD